MTPEQYEARRTRSIDQEIRWGSGEESVIVLYKQHMELAGRRWFPEATSDDNRDSGKPGTTAEDLHEMYEDFPGADDVEIVSIESRTVEVTIEVVSQVQILGAADGENAAERLQQLLTDVDLFEFIEWRSSDVQRSLESATGYIRGVNHGPINHMELEGITEVQ